ncbi:hypothetical protein E3N88_08633 [Mikania micrantha]|uniref:Aminotransferase-like plant mobile domain-containing protein n=1 Tax=Mikania micrantha TaxID=192012 RepID=A0A5N6PHQ9_9ASTR|nr:hypothetical protein E3N88_08633 [Mikania micrantha]
MMYKIRMRSFRVSDISKADISGPMFLLQLWTWERFSGFAPETVNGIDFQKPYGARWRSPLTYVRTATHVLSAYRSQLHSLTEDKFNWRPYDNVFHLLPGFCLSGQVQHHMGYYPTHMSQDPVGYQVPLVPQSIRRPERRMNRRQPQLQHAEAQAQAEPDINSPHISSMDQSNNYRPNSPSLNFGEIGTSSHHLSQFGTQNYEDAGPSGYNPLENYNTFQSPDYSQDIQQNFLSPSSVNPFYRQSHGPKEFTWADFKDVGRGVVLGQLRAMVDRNTPAGPSGYYGPIGVIIGSKESNEPSSLGL